MSLLFGNSVVCCIWSSSPTGGRALRLSRFLGVSVFPAQQAHLRGFQGVIPPRGHNPLLLARCGGQFMSNITPKKSTKRNGKGTALVWFRNDLRVHDNEALLEAWRESEVLVGLYCFDPRMFGQTHYFGFPKTGELRAQFLAESVRDLVERMRERSSLLLVRVGEPEGILPLLVSALNIHTVYAQKETCDEEVCVEKAVEEALVRARGSERQGRVRVRWLWGSTMYHINDIPFPTPADVPDVYTAFRKGVESRSTVRQPVLMPSSLGPPPDDRQMAAAGGAGEVPAVDELCGLGGRSALNADPRGVMMFKGGETAALARLEDYFWKQDLLRVYKETRNGMLGPNYSSKFSPWLALGCISPRFIHAEVQRYEKERVANESTYWLLFEVIWRDYFRFLSMKYGNSIFHIGGPRKLKNLEWKKDEVMFAAWKDGRTGYPLVDASMRELGATGFMSNRGRQIVCSFLTRDMGIDWRMGAEHFETMLLDYDPASNYGNWTYGAGVGTDPREDRYFSIPKQAQNYDAAGEYVAHWIPALKKLPPNLRHAPYKLTPSEKSLYGLRTFGGAHGHGRGDDAAAAGGGGGVAERAGGGSNSDELYPNPIVPLKFGGSPAGGRGGGGGRSNFVGRGRGRGRSGTSAKF